LFRPLPGGAAQDQDHSMPGRIGKTYPRAHSAAQPQQAARPRARRYGAIGGLIALLSALGVLGWLIFR
jgi:hypothetical protein